MRHIIRAGAVVAAAALALTACSGGGGSGADGGEEPAALNIGNFLDVTNWDPARPTSGSTVRTCPPSTIR